MTDTNECNEHRWAFPSTLVEGNERICWVCGLKQQRLWITYTSGET